MIPEAQRIAIAEACGWQMVTPDDRYPYGIDPHGDRMHTIVLPDYLNDLNAMHEAERWLGDDDLWLEYLLCLCSVCEKHADLGKWTLARALMSATAAQRAEAFLRTVGKWVES